MPSFTKSVLPTLFRFTYLTDFYGEALLGDPDAFLSALNQLQEKDQKAVAAGIAGPTVGLRNKERFEAIRAVLNGIPDAAPNRRRAGRMVRIGSQRVTG